MIILFISHQTICCDPSSEPSCQDGSDEGHNIYFYAELTKIIHNYHQILSSDGIFKHTAIGIPYLTLKVPNKNGSRRHFNCFTFIFHQE